MVEKETFKAQAEAVKELLEVHRERLSAAQQKHLGCACRNLEALSELRRAVIDSAADDAELRSEALAEQIIALLHIPAKM